jgi:hypothetical protein
MPASDRGVSRADHPRRTSANNQLLVRILQDEDYRVKAFDASQIQRIDQIGAAGELLEAAMRLRQPCGSGQRVRELFERSKRAPTVRRISALTCSMRAGGSA